MMGDTNNLSILSHLALRSRHLFRLGAGCSAEHLVQQNSTLTSQHRTRLKAKNRWMESEATTIRERKEKREGAE